MTDQPYFALKKRVHIFVILLLSGLFSGCDNSKEPAPESELDIELRAVIEEKALTGDPAEGRDLPSIDTPLAQLGMKLFFSKALGGDMDAACVTCHHPMLGGGDDLSLPVGVDADVIDLLGPGRTHSSGGEHFDGGPTVPRNAPSTFNLALWDRVLFHDGRVESLGKTAGVNGNDGAGIRTPDVAVGMADPEAGDNLAVAQARFPVTSPEEMKNFGFFNGASNAEVREHLEQRLGGYGTPPGGALAHNDWLSEFQLAFSDPDGTAETLITFENISLAIAEYERSQVFVDTPWKAYVQGDNDAIDDAAKRGALIFFKSIAEGGADCAACHSGDFFTDEGFHVIGMPQIGRGKGDGDSGDDDFGRFRETGIEADRYSFRTPTLLNTTATGPWGHAGAYTRLENAVRHHLNPQWALDNFDWSQLDPNLQASNMLENTQLAIDKLEANRALGIPSLQNVVLSDAQVNDLMAFLETLTDPCVENRACLSPWIPDASDSNPDAMRLNARDENGRFL
ncbi:MAG: cytochrome c peroxidase [Oleiphilaceae bacterium]|nr:cytochrome c peroxidase [Oleiphilaceae bacterium]